MKKFKEKNAENIEKLNIFIDENKEKIRLIIASSEMFQALLDYYEAEDILNDMLKYRGKRVIKDAYQPSWYVGFMMNEPVIKFNVPCLCGIYQDEPHDHLQKQKEK